MSIVRPGKKYNPLVSIVIPVYNGSNFVKDAINSALDQTYKNIEILVINDGSTDNTEEIVKSYGKKVRYFKKENGGVASALNLGIKKSKGEYISWLSHDDMYSKVKIHLQIAELRKIDKRLRRKTISYSNYLLVDKNANFLSHTGYHLLHSAINLTRFPYPLLNGLVNGCTLLIPKDVFTKHGMFDENLPNTQDYELWFKLFPKCTLIFCKEATVMSRKHNRQGTSIFKSTPEYDNLWIDMISKVTHDQIINMYESEYIFYCSVFHIVKKAGYKGVARFLQKKINSFPANMRKDVNLWTDKYKSLPYRIYNKIQKIKYRISTQ
ncbi:MAG: glycosyltransferase [Microgenomates group bacterium]